MSRQVTITDTISKDIGSYDSTNYAWASQSNIANCYGGSDSTTYGQINLTTGSNAQTYVYFIFDSLSAIPSTATITSVSCTCKCSISTTTSSRVSTRQAQLYTGTTAMGTAYTVANSTTAFSITAGTWTRAQLQNARLRIYAVRGTSNTTTNYYFRLYGATITVNYSYQGTAYTITSSSNVSGVTIQPASQEVMQGESAEVSLSDKTNVVVTDNNVDVTNQFVQVLPGTISQSPASQTNTGISSGSSYAAYAVGHTAESPYSSSTSNMYASSGSTGHVDYVFDFSDIPAGATISSVSVKAYGHAESSTYTSGSRMAEIQLYSGTTAKGTAQHYTSTSNSILTLSSPGTWTRAELQNAILRFTVANYGGLILGITWSVTYEVNGYVYTLTNVSADHTILVVAAGGLSYDLRVKVNGAWVKATKVYVKQSGTWHEASDVLAKSGGTWH